MLDQVESLTTGPIWVASSIGRRPAVPPPVAPGHRGIDRLIASVTIKRDVAVHFLARRPECAEHHLFESQVEVGVVEDDGRVLPPISACTGTPRAVADAAIRRPTAVGPGEGDGVDAGVVHNRLADRWIADHQVEHTGRKSGVRQCLGEPDGQSGTALAGFRPRRCRTPRPERSSRPESRSGRRERDRADDADGRRVTRICSPARGEAYSSPADPIAPAP